jgi:8-oxo-dGTP pyrophosphatase MutT (NUDIX family)
MGEDDLIQAATVVLVRDGGDGLEALMLRRNSRIAFGGSWVFPGGRLDGGELATGDEEAAARAAATREVAEETRLSLDADDLEPWSHWIPPPAPPTAPRGSFKRFSTWFFVAASPPGVVVVDGGEIHEHRWLAPATALDLRDRGEIELVPPTWVTLWHLRRHRSVGSVLAEARSRRPELFRTRPIAADPLTLAWAGDAAYGGGDHTDDGPRHRLVMEPSAWVYLRTAN